MRTATQTKRETSPLDGVLAAMQPGLEPICKYVGNGAAVVLLADALVTLELDDRDPRCRVWIETERVDYVVTDEELWRLSDWLGWVDWQVKHWKQAEADDYMHVYFDLRRERIRLAYEAAVAKLRGAMRPMGAVPTVGMEAGCPF